MSEGFNSTDKGKAKVEIDKEEIQKLIKKYKNIKKYMKSSMFVIKTMDKNEDIVRKLIEEYEENPL